MKKVLVLSLAALTLLITAPKSMALSVQVDAGSYQIDSGGEFQLTPTGFPVPGGYAGTTSSSTSFQSFCLENNEYISFGNSYTVALNTYAVAGGVAGATGPSGDPLSQGAAYLYSQFARGTLSGYDYTNGAAARKATAGQLQLAIWYLEQESEALPVAWIDALLTGQFGSSLAARTTATPTQLSQYGVRVLNLTTGSTLNQDMLVLVPDGGLTVTLLGIALGSLAFVSRKIRKS